MGNGKVYQTILPFFYEKCLDLAQNLAMKNEK